MAGERAPRAERGPRAGRDPRAGRGPDRRIAVLGAIGGGLALVVALAAALATAVAPGAVPSASWLPLHLALALGAGLAIAAVLPFFASSLAAAAPASVGVRVAAVAIVGAGALLAIVALPGGAWQVAAGAAVLFAVGIGLVAWAAFRPLATRRRSLDRAVYAAYAVGLADVAVSVLLVAGGLAGWTPLVEGWAAMRAAHAWLNLFGFLGLVVGGTLLHLLPTTLGGRIGAGGGWRVLAVAGLAVGPPVVALGLLLDLDALTSVGAIAALVGAGSLVAVALFALRRRGRWTTDAGWHRFVAGSLASAVAWFLLATTLAAMPLLVVGADPATWSFRRVAAPLVAGWVGLAVLGAASHLVPSIGPGTPQSHARQRRVLGRRSWPRLLLLQTGVALLTIALPKTAGQAAAGASGASVERSSAWLEIALVLGWAALAVGTATTVLLLVVALADGVRSERTRTAAG